MRGGELRKLRTDTVSMVYQEPGKALNPTIRVGPQVAEVFEIAGLGKAESLDRVSRDAREGADLRSGRRDEPLSPSAVGRDAAARRDRDGARRGAVAADPRRADDRAGRDRRGRGARPDLGTAQRVSDVAAVHQPQPRCDREDVRSRRRSVRRRADRGGPGARGVRQPAPPVHGRAAALHPAPRHAQDAREARHDPGLSAGAGAGREGLHLRRPLRTGGGPLPRGVTAAVRRRPGAALALSLPRARTDVAARGAGRARAAPRGPSNRHATDRGGECVQDVQPGRPDDLRARRRRRRGASRRDARARR